MNYYFPKTHYNTEIQLNINIYHNKLKIFKIITNGNFMSLCLVFT